MLSRTAENLYWTARYFERAETTARLLEVGYRLSMMPSSEGGYMNEWESILSAAEVTELFYQYYDEMTKENIQNFLIFDERHPSSIKSCIKAGRENARAARTALTSEVWETINHTYLRFQEKEARREKISLQEICDWTKRRTSMLRGMFDNTQLQDQGFDFFSLGYYIERADNTARLLDMKYYVLLPTMDMVGGGVDTYQWFTLLRSMSARRSFHWTYSGDYAPDKIAHFLILNENFPRSIFHCVKKIHHHLHRLSRGKGVHTSAHDYVNRMMEEIEALEVDDIIASGLHEFLAGFITQNAKMTDEIAQAYLFGVS